ncbi:MAG: glycosyl transferase [Kiritimatiellae bacterium]|nr:glycosyl transferase [Kiritimatiellia bacterium]
MANETAGSTMAEDIPKVIHYCWFGMKPKPALVRRCIASWRKYFPDYEIHEWNEANFDVNAIRYTREAYAQKKYAFVSDYARFKILEAHGGLYLDTDVEVIAPWDEILARGAFMGAEQDPLDGDFTVWQVNPGLGFAVAPGNAFCKAMIAAYQTRAFLLEEGACDLTTVVETVTQALLAHGVETGASVIHAAGLRIYPAAYFNPKPHHGRLVLAPETRAIHHFADSWHSPRTKAIQWTKRHFGVPLACILALLLRNPLKIPSRIFRFLQEGK